MGHYLNEMHLAGPSEQYGEMLERARQHYGFFKIEIGYKKFFACQICSSVVISPQVHFYACSKIKKKTRLKFTTDIESAKAQICRSLAGQSELARLNQEEVPTWLDRLTLLRASKSIELDAWVFDIALAQLLLEQRLSEHREPMSDIRQSQYRDKYFFLNVLPAEPEPTPSPVAARVGCRADHSRLRGVKCDECGTYFRGDSSG